MFDFDNVVSEIAADLLTPLVKACLKPLAHPSGRMANAVQSWLRRTVAAQVCHFKTLARWRKTAIVGWSIYAVGALVTGFVMGDHTPLAVQAWTASVAAMMIVGYGWLTVRQAQRIRRRLFV